MSSDAAPHPSPSADAIPASRLSLFQLALVAGFNLAVLAVLTGARLAPAPGEAVLAWFPKGEQAGVDAVLESGGRLLSVGPHRGLVQARSDDPGFAATLRQAGAAIVVSNTGFGCSSPRET